MTWAMKTTKLSRSIVTLYLVVTTRADTAKFFYSNWKDYCAWNANIVEATNNTAHGALCAFAPSINRVYACPAPDPICWTFAQTCANGPNPGPNQIKCSNKIYDQEWCCQSQETCTLNVNQHNVCWSRFTSLNKGVSIENAVEAEYAMVPPESIVTTTITTRVTTMPSAFSTITYVVADNSAISGTASGPRTAATTGTSTPTSSSLPSSSAIPHSGISRSAIAGIVVGVLAALGIVAGFLVFCVRRRRTRSHTIKSSLSPEESLDSENRTPVPVSGYAGYYGPEAYRQSTIQQAQQPSFPAEAPAESDRRIEMHGKSKRTYELQ